MTKALSLGVKRPGRETDHSPPFRHSLRMCGPNLDSHTRLYNLHTDEFATGVDTNLLKVNVVLNVHDFACDTQSQLIVPVL